MQKYIGICSLILLAACSSDSGGGLNDGWMNYRNNGVPTNNNNITSMVQNNDLKLADANFAMSNDDAGFGTDMKFAVSDNGVIVGIKFADATAVRTGGNTTYFSWPNGGGGKSISISGSSSDGLQYSDFGRIFFNVDGKSENAHYATFAGGYTDKALSGKPSNDMTFKGKALGYVHGRNGKVLPVDGSATLNFNGGKESLSANFKDWYTVDVTDGKMSFSGYTPSEKDGNNFEFDNPTNVSGNFSTTYYGDDKTAASEVIGSIGYTENSSGIKLDAAFGGVKQ